MSDEFDKRRERLEIEGTNEIMKKAQEKARLEKEEQAKKEEAKEDSDEEE